MGKITQDSGRSTVKDAPLFYQILSLGRGFPNNNHFRKSIDILGKILIISFQSKKYHYTIYILIFKYNIIQHHSIIR